MAFIEDAGWKHALCTYTLHLWFGITWKFNWGTSILLATNAQFHLQSIALILKVMFYTKRLVYWNISVCLRANCRVFNSVRVEVSFTWERFWVWYFLQFRHICVSAKKKDNIQCPGRWFNFFHVLYLFWCSINVCNVMYQTSLDETEMYSTPCFRKHESLQSWSTSCGKSGCLILSSLFFEVVVNDSVESFKWQQLNSKSTNSYYRNLRNV